MKMKYRILAYPDNKYDTELESGEYEDIDEAVRHAMSVYGNDFLIISVIDWHVVSMAVES